MALPGASSRPKARANIGAGRIVAAFFCGSARNEKVEKPVLARTPQTGGIAAPACVAVRARCGAGRRGAARPAPTGARSEETASDLQSQLRITHVATGLTR